MAKDIHAGGQLFVDVVTALVGEFLPCEASVISQRERSDEQIHQRRHHWTRLLRYSACPRDGEARYRTVAPDDNVPKYRDDVPLSV